MGSERIAVLGAGSWGATLAQLLSEKGHDVSLWEFDAKAATALQQTRTLRVLPDLKLSPGVRVSAQIGEVLDQRSLIVSATPSQFVRGTVKAAAASGKLAPHAAWVSVAKGLEDKTLKRMSQVIADEAHVPTQQVAVLSGPSHAEEVCRHLPTAMVSASVDSALATRVQQLFTQPYFRVYTHDDLVGVELGGTLKNIFAIGCGISDGIGLGDNSKAAIMTRGLNEMSRLGVKMGGKLLTFFGLAGMGDLIVTCLSRHSRNRLFGEKIGQGKTPDQALAEMTMVTEGHKTAPAAFALTQQLGVDCPLIQEIYAVLYQQKNPKQSLRDLMERETPPEWRDPPTV
jgi:glycerol-3-phosphate dehydrogenase (NAD(P)+)